MAIRSRVDGFAANIDSIRTNVNSGNHIPVTFDLSSLGVQSGQTEFRVYYWNVGGAGIPNWGGWSGSSINGGHPAFGIFGGAPDPQPAPEPSTLASLGLGILVLRLARYRRRRAVRISTRAKSKLAVGTA